MAGRDELYRSGDWEIDLARREMRQSGTPIPLGSRAFDVLEVLVESAGELVPKHQLMDRVWSGNFVEENTLQVHISAVRKALGQDRVMLKSAFGQGYRLLGDWRAQQKPSAPSSMRSTNAAATTSVRERSTNLPAKLSNLIGRTSEVRRLRDLLSAYRVVTLTGAAGIGKTVLAVNVARELSSTFPGEICLVELASLADPALVPSAVAHTLGLNLGGAAISPERVATAIGTKSLLLIIDNCEHVVDAAARLVEAVVRICSRTTVVATSREILRVEGEYVYRVPPLSVPALQEKESVNILGHSAVELFIARTAALQSSLTLDDENVGLIATICQRLDGIPLAIEFAAARAAMLGLQQVVSHLDDRFGLLTEGRRTALARHRTLRATLDWSYDLLTPWEQRLLRGLGIFSAGFTLQAASAVINETNETAAVVEGLAELVSKSLVVMDRAAASDRWRLLETIRAYALEKLDQSGEVEQVAYRHAQFLCNFMAPFAPGTQSPLEGGDLARFAREIDNVRTALDWCFSPRGSEEIGVRLTAAFAPMWIHLAFVVECRERIERALGRIDPQWDFGPLLRMQLDISLGYALMVSSASMKQTETVFSQGLEIAESLHNVPAQFETLRATWALQINSGNFHAAQSSAHRLARIARREGNFPVASAADQFLGIALHHAGKQGDARRCLESALQVSLSQSDERRLATLRFDPRVMARAVLTRILWLQGFPDQAGERARLLFEEQRVVGNELDLWQTLRFALCPVSLLRGDWAVAESAIATLMELATTRNAPFWKLVASFFQGKLLIKRGAFSAGAALVRTAAENFESSGWGVWYPELVGTLAEGLAGLGEISEAMAMIRKGMARAERDGERWYIPELVRLNGELELAGGLGKSISAAEDCFVRSIELAQEQQALSWELRAATGLARLRIAQKQPDEARSLLSPVYHRFSEGFATADLRTARTVIDSLAY